MKLFVCAILLTALSAINVSAQTSEIHQAIKEKNLLRVKLLLGENPSPVNAKDPKDGNTALHLAAGLGDQPIVKLLLSEHADVNSKNNEGLTPLDVAFDLEHGDPGFGLGIIKLLLDHGANIKGSDILLGLYVGEIDRDISDILVQLFLQHGANPNVTDGKSTPLDNAVDAESEEGAAILVKYGARSGFELANGEVKNGELSPKDWENIQRLRADASPGEISTQPTTQRKSEVKIGLEGRAGSAITATINRLFSLKKNLQYPLSNVKNYPREPYALGVNVSQIEFETERRRYTLRKYSTHNDYIKSILSRDESLDAIILVEAASANSIDTIRQQITFAKKLGIPALIIVLNAGGAGANWKLTQTKEQDVRKMLSNHGYTDKSSFVMSGKIRRQSRAKSTRQKAIADAHIIPLLRAFDERIPEPVPDTDKPFLLPLEDIFRIAERGRAVTGRIKYGRIQVGDRVHVIGRGLPLDAAVAGLEMFKKTSLKAEAGDNIGILLRGIERTVVTRGMVLAAPGSISAHSRFEAEIYLLIKMEGGLSSPMPDNFRPQFYFWTSDMAGTIELPNKKPMPSGTQASVNIELRAPVAMKEGVRFAIRLSGRTIALGVVTKILN